MKGLEEHSNLHFLDAFYLKEDSIRMYLILWFKHNFIVLHFASIYLKANFWKMQLFLEARTHRS